MINDMKIVLKPSKPSIDVYKSVRKSFAGPSKRHRCISEYKRKQGTWNKWMN